MCAIFTCLCQGDTRCPWMSEGVSGGTVSRSKPDKHYKPSKPPVINQQSKYNLRHPKTTTLESASIDKQVAMADEDLTLEDTTNRR